MANTNRTFFGKSSEMLQLKQMIKRCADTDASVLISGETGTGKEVMCRELHQQSSRKNGPFVPINCAAIPAALLESELFGFSKGAFTGAISDRAGRFQLANSGTLFLDEIGDMPLELQAKMLRVLEERVVEPIGGTEAKPIDVRIIAATHRDLNEMVKKGTFRQDLYFRINVLPIRIPSIIERKGDILSLCQFFARKHAKGNSPISFTPESAEVLLAYSWPGNVREISNLMMRFSVLHAGEKIEIRNLPSYLLPDELVGIIEKLSSRSNERGMLEDNPGLKESDAFGELEPELDHEQNKDNESEYACEEISSAGIEGILRLSHSISSIPEEGIQAKKLMANIEIELIKAALRQSKGSVSQAAQLLSLQRTTLIQKVARYNIATSFL